MYGAVQGMGFRPFLYRLAAELGVTGWVENSPQGVVVEVEGSREVIEAFLHRMEVEKPPYTRIQRLELALVEPVGDLTFTIRESAKSGHRTASILPDIATCAACLREVFDPANRRYRYPFTNCTSCGPRFSIIESLPYDRPNTTMKAFQMCELCVAEYRDPVNRRFHAQPNACPRCGPHVEAWDAHGRTIATRHAALSQAIDAIRDGAVVAVKGIGGFHLTVDARNEHAVLRLRKRKGRDAKPLALMYPSMAMVKGHCEVSELEAQLLASPAAPITLLKRRSSVRDVASSVAPGNPYLGIMLPYTPLHHLLVADLGFPIVATSGNVSDEPMCTDEREALHRLGQVADVFLVHNRPIARHIDDSVARVLMEREQVLRRARGYAPMPIHVREVLPNTLAVGGHLKNTIAVSIGHDVVVSQHIGDLETDLACDAFHRTIADFARLYGCRSPVVMKDAHPDYLSSQPANVSGATVGTVQHHFAHILSCMADNGIDGSVLGVAWDGAGFGADRTVWGGEFLLVRDYSWERAAHLRTFQLPGGDKAGRQPWRSAVGLLYELFGDGCFTLEGIESLRALSAGERGIVKRMLAQRLNTPRTSSAGRLFDGVASLLGLQQDTSFEGQAAMGLEFATEGIRVEDHYDFDLRPACGASSTDIVDWAGMILGILEDVRRGLTNGAIATKFHNTLVEAIVAVSCRVGMERVVLTGGCFQNRYLSERAIRRLREEGFAPYWHHLIPPNDGGIALGQVMAASRFSALS